MSFHKKIINVVNNRCSCQFTTSKKKALNKPMPLSFSSAVSNSVARLSNRKLDFLSGVAKAQLLVVSCLISAKACRSPKSCLDRTEVEEGEEKGKGTLGNSLAINSDEEEVAAMAMITGGHCSLSSD